MRRKTVFMVLRLTFICLFAISVIVSNIKRGSEPMTEPLFYAHLAILFICLYLIIPERNEE